jgi:hypothetical protein
MERSSFMKLEYRTAGGAAFEIAANGHLVAATVNLRALGCPDWIAEKVERARAARRPAESGSGEIVYQHVMARIDDMNRKRAEQIGKEVQADLQQRANEIGEENAELSAEITRHDELKQRMHILAGRTTR